MENYKQQESFGAGENNEGLNEIAVETTPEPEPAVEADTESEDTSTSVNPSRRNFIKSGIATLAAMSAEFLSPPLKAEKPGKTESVRNPEREESILKKIGLEREAVEPKFLAKYFEGAYKAIIIIDTDPDIQKIKIFDKDGNAQITEAEIANRQNDIATGRSTMPTPKGSFESGIRKKDYVNKDDIDMPYAVAIDASNGVYMHKGTITGFPTSHGCVRLREGVAIKVFDMAEKNKALLIVIR